ncbi:MAG TPA: lyase family protein, partial [Steroidobacteraceae bacterium]|nr:lyase family protein [Steroidobacteraceae bacterium]
MSNGSFDALSPLDGRYAAKLGALREIFSEAGLMRERARVECAWLLAMSEGPARASLAALPAAAHEWLRGIAKDPRATDVAAIKAIERRTNHDVKAVEYWLRAELQSRGAAPAQLEWVHFGCTSEDINNLAYALMLQAARAQIILPTLERLMQQLDTLAERHADVGMLGRTHGQTATPTTVGKEFANFAA